MANDLEIYQDTVSIEEKSLVVIDSEDNHYIQTIEPIVQVFPDEFVLSSGMWSNGNGLIGAVPSWLLDAIKEQLTNGTGNVTDLMNDLKTAMDGLVRGVNQTITSLNTSTLSLNAITTGLKSEVDGNHAEVLNVLATRVTETEAQALVSTGIRSVFGDNAEAFVGRIASTYVDEDSAIAQDIGMIQASLNDITASITSIDEITISDVRATISDLERETAVTVADLQRQLDGTIDSWFYAGVPGPSVQPESLWTTDGIKNSHLGDLYFDRDTGYSYRYVHEDIEGDSPDLGVVYAWARVADSDVTLALSAAAAAQATADGKKSTYYTGSIPIPQVIDGITIPIGEGDIWINSTTKITKVYSNTGVWVDITNTATQKAIVSLSVLEETNDGVVLSFYQATAPLSGMSYGDWWINNSVNPPVAYRYQDATGKNVGTLSWANESTSLLAQGYINSAKATTLADSKSTIFYTIVAPTKISNPTLDIGDQWVNRTDPLNPILKIWNGNAWVDTTNETSNRAYIEASRVKNLFSQGIGSIPIAIGIGDLWVVTDRWYTANGNSTASGSTKTSFGYLVKTWNGTAWIDATYNESKLRATNWSAKSAKYITAPDGSITGFEMVDGTETKSAFTITADTFKIVASSQTALSRNPFTVNAATGEISFNGKVTFNSISDASTTIPTIASVSTATSSSLKAVEGAAAAFNKAEAANTAALAAKQAADTAMIEINNVSNDSILSKIEKPAVNTEFNTLSYNNQALRKDAALYSITTEKDAHQLSMTQLSNYLYVTLWPSARDTFNNTAINGAVFRGFFSSAYTTEMNLRNKITERAQEAAYAAAQTANWSQVTARPTSLQQLNATDYAALAAATDAITAMGDDNKITAAEKTALRLEWSNIVGEVPFLQQQAGSVAATAELNAYINSISALGNYMNGSTATAWTYSSSATIPLYIQDQYLNVASIVVGNTFRNIFKTYYDSRSALVAKITSSLKTSIDSAYRANDGTDWARLVNSSVTNINGGKIEAGTITAGSINSSVFQGMTITGATMNGGVINGAYIRGSVIEASYIVQSAGNGTVSDYRQVSISEFIGFSTELQSKFICEIKTWDQLQFYEKAYFGNNPATYKGRMPSLDGDQKCFLPVRLPCVWSPTQAPLSLYTRSYNTGIIGGTYTDLTPYDDYLSSASALRCKSLNPVFTFADPLLVIMRQDNDKWAPAYAAVKVLDRVLVCDWYHADGVLRCGHRVFTYAGFPETQSGVADGGQYTYRGSGSPNYGSATMLASDVRYTYSRNYSWSYAGVTILIDIGFAIGGGSGIRLRIGNNPIAISGFTSSNAWAIDPKALGVMFTMCAAGHDSVAYNVTRQLSPITVT